MAFSSKLIHPTHNIRVSNTVIQLEVFLKPKELTYKNRHIEVYDFICYKCFYIKNVYSAPMNLIECEKELLLPCKVKRRKH